MTTITLIETPEYNIRGEFLWFGVILHSDVFVRWTKEVRRRFRSDLDITVSRQEVPVYAFQTPSCDPLKRKFIKSVGGIFDHTRQTGDGEWAEMYRFHSLGPIQRKSNGKSFQVKDYNDTTAV